jgi:hypothetical protein
MFTLYRARGNQIERFGYAAFGLTVAPYAVVSVLNLLGSGLCPEFAALYMVESLIMKEAAKRGKKEVFTGTVGVLDEEIFRAEKDSSADQGGITQSPRAQWILESLSISEDAEEDPKCLKVKSENQIGLSRVTLTSDQGRDSTVAKASNNDAVGNEVRSKRHASSVQPPAQNFGQTLLHFLEPFPFANTLMKKMGISLTQLQLAVTEPIGSSSKPPENVILIPYMNPIKEKNRTRKIESYKLSSAEPGGKSTDP